MAGSASSPIGFSFVLCTKNRSEQLATCLDAIESMEGAEGLQLLLVDNGSTDGKTYDILKRFAAVSKFECEVFQCMQRGNAAGRNAALPSASGRYILFVDDDCYVDRFFVQEWRKTVQSHDLGYGTGMVKRFDPASSMLACNESCDQQLVSAGQFVNRGLVQGSNMMFRADCLAAVGPFDTRFGAGTPYAGEEWDVALRASYAGWRGGYFPGPKVAHDHRRAGAEAADRELFYDYGGGAVYAKNSIGVGGLRTARKFLGEWRRQRDKKRRAALAKGYLEFALRSVARKS